MYYLLKMQLDKKEEYCLPKAQFKSLRDARQTIHNNGTNYCQEPYYCQHCDYYHIKTVGRL